MTAWRDIALHAHADRGVQVTDSDTEAMRRQAWGDYWSSGRLHSCADGSGRNYDGAIGAFWHERFADVRAGDRLLDLATGNGALPQLVRQLRGGSVIVDAVDLAPVAPQWLDADVSESIRFHPGVRMEALPFPSESFDHVVSQFGLEYADPNRAITECVRVARPGAHFAFVMHHADSVLVNVGREELAHHALLEAPDGLLAAARDVVPWIARIKSGVAQVQAQDAVRARTRYNRAMQALAAGIAVSSAPDLLIEARDRVHRLVAATGADEVPVVVQLQAYGAALEGARLRTAEMVSHALDDARMEAFTRIFEASRMDVSMTRAVLRQSEGIVGWAWVADPAG